jgi:rhamnosyltransferase subunit B
MEQGRTGKRIVLATYGSPGDLYPFLAVGAELRDRGHVPVVATSERYRETVLAAGLGFASVRPDRISGQQDPDFLDRIWRDRRAPKRVFGEMFLPALRQSLEDLLGVVDGADMVVSHTLTPAAALAAETSRVPWVSAVMRPMGYLSAHEPPVVGPSWVAAVLRAVGASGAAPLLAVVRALTAEWMGEWHELRVELGLAQVDRHPLWEGQHAPRRSLGLFPRILGEPQLDWPPQARVTGFPFFRPLDRALDPIIEQFLANGEPPLVFTLGTTAVNDPGAFFDESVKAARRLRRRALLLTGQSGPESTAGATGDVLAIPYAPHDLVFPRALAVVHQGGIGTLAEGLLAGRAMLIMPYGHDQFDNAWRAERLGAARRLSRRRYRADRVSRALSALLEDAMVAAAARNAGESVSQERGAERAAELIEAALLSD